MLGDNTTSMANKGATVERQQLLCFKIDNERENMGKALHVTMLCAII